LPRTINQVQPALEFIPPALDPSVVWVAQKLLPAWLRLKTSIRHIQAENVETLAKLLHEFQAGKIRLLLAFRHPRADDPLCLAYLLSQLVPKAAQQTKLSLQSPVHAHFIYDRGIPLWAGPKMGWLYSRLGGTPIHRGKVDRMGLRSARDLLVNGKFPLAASPEGATNGHNEIISPLEPGIAQLAFWCVEDLVKANRSEQVLILPIGIHYHYITPPWAAIEQLITELEVDSGLIAEQSANTQLAPWSEASLYQRLYRLGEHLLSVMEQYYTRFYHQSFPADSVPEGETPSLSNEAFATRLNTLLNAALNVAEQYFGLEPKGSVIDRCRRLEQAGWDYIYREDIKNVEALSPLERGLADRTAEEADLRMWHMRLVESFVAVTGKYVLEKPTVERFAETTLLTWDMMTRIKGGNPFARPKLGDQAVQLTIGEPISVSDRWSTYQGNRRAAKQAVTDLTQDLQQALEALLPKES
jgi:1-acyl-sn-glycerol-3-phosphate acyltransferase